MKEELVEELEHKKGDTKDVAIKRFKILCVLSMIGSGLILLGSSFSYFMDWKGFDFFLQGVMVCSVFALKFIGAYKMYKLDKRGYLLYFIPASIFIICLLYIIINLIMVDPIIDVFMAFLFCGVFLFMFFRFKKYLKSYKPKDDNEMKKQVYEDREVDVIIEELSGEAPVKNVSEEDWDGRLEEDFNVFGDTLDEKHDTLTNQAKGVLIFISVFIGFLKAIIDNAGDFIQIILFAIFYPIIFGILPAAIVSIFTKKFSYKLVFIFSLIAFILSTIGTYQLNNIAP